MRLRPGLAILWRGPTSVQLGTDPRWSVVLTDLSPSAAAALRGLSAGADARDLRDALVAEQVPPWEAQAVLAHLRSARLLVPEPSPTASGPDVAAWSLLCPDGAGGAVLETRRRGVVRVCGLGQVGSGVATLLATAGVGTLELDDPGRATRADVAPGGTTSRYLGDVRTAATAKALHDVVPGIRTTGPGRHPVDLVVLVEHGVADPLRYRALMDEDAPHLSVVLREASALVGPLVVPGRSACLRCVDLHRTDEDDGWPAVAPQLVGWAADHGVETTLAATCAAIAAAQVLAHLDGRATSVHDASLEIRLPEVTARRIAWSPHPDCDCAGPPRSRPPQEQGEAVRQT